MRKVPQGGKPKREILRLALECRIPEGSKWVELVATHHTYAIFGSVRYEGWTLAHLPCVPDPVGGRLDLSPLLEEHRSNC